MGALGVHRVEEVQRADSRAEAGPLIWGRGGLLEGGLDLGDEEGLEEFLAALRAKFIQPSLVVDLRDEPAATASVSGRDEGAARGASWCMDGHGGCGSADDDRKAGAAHRSCKSKTWL